MRILWCSDAPWSVSGYANITRQQAPALARLGHDVALLATFGLHGAVREWEGLRIYPGGADSFANDAIPHAARDWQADIVITLKDSFVFKPEAFQGLRWCVPGGTLVTLDNGDQMLIKEIVERRLPVKVKAWDGKKTVAADILDYQRISSSQSGELIRIDTEDGDWLEVTAENQILVLRNGVIDWIEAGCVIPGDVVYCNSSIPLNNGGDDGTTQGSIGQGARTHTRVSAAVNPSGVGVRCGDYRWRGDDLYQSSEEARSLGTAPDGFSDEHQRGTNDVVGGKTRYVDRQTPTPTIDQVRQDVINWVRNRHAWIPIVPHIEISRADVDYQGRTCTDSHGLYGEQDAPAIQRTVYGGGEGFVAPCEGFEPKSVSRIQQRGKPYSFVYDLTTSAGNFVADGILIHNCGMVPVDHEPLPPAVAQVARAMYRPIAYAPNGFRELRKAGFDPLFCPHSFDPRIFYPEDRAKARAAFNFPDDLFVIGTVAVNRGGVPSRKAWPQNLEAFALFAKDKPNVRYFLHTDLATDGFEGGVNIPALCAQLGIGDKILYCDQTMYRRAQYPDDYLRTFYSAIDVLNAVSVGEGFGIPMLEAQACGCPIIASDFAAARDLCFGGWKVEEHNHYGEPGALRFYDGQGAWVFVPLPGAIRQRMETAYRAWQGGTLVEFGAQAIRGAAPYALDRVIVEHWKPALEELERQIACDKGGRGVLRIIRKEEVLG